MWRSTQIQDEFITEMAVPFFFFFFLQTLISAASSWPRSLSPNVHFVSLEQDTSFAATLLCPLTNFLTLENCTFGQLLCGLSYEAFANYLQ
jgi:hypothetical protein